MPAEFSADVLIRIASSEQVEKARRIELLAQAFQRAAGAQQPFKRHAAPMQSDGVPTYWNRVYSQDLDALSLRLRAVEALVPLDPAKALELFRQIPVPTPPRVTCEDFLVYDVSRFYSVLGTLADRADPTEAFTLLRRYSGALSSPVQAAPLIHVLASAKVSDADYRTLVDSFTDALAKLTGDDRSFAYSTSIGRELQAWVPACERRKISSMRLLEAYRVYLVIHLSGDRCSDDDLMKGNKPRFGAFAAQPPEDDDTDLVAFFNEKLRRAPLQPIQELEAMPAHVKGAAAGLRVCEDEECRSIAAAIRKLVVNPEGTIYLPAEREKPEWQQRLRDLLHEVADWKQTKELSPAEYYRERSAAYSELVNFISSGPDREPILRAALKFAQGSHFAAENRMEWFLPVNVMIGRAGLDPLGLGKLAAEMRASNDPVIALYANLEALAPRPPLSILSIL